MAFMLGSFAGGLFGGLTSGLQLYNMYQGVMDAQRQADIYDTVKNAQTQDALNKDVPGYGGSQNGAPTAVDQTSAYDQQEQARLAAENRANTKDASKPVVDLAKAGITPGGAIGDEAAAKVEGEIGARALLAGKPPGTQVANPPSQTAVTEPNIEPTKTRIAGALKATTGVDVGGDVGQGWVGKKFADLTTWWQRGSGSVPERSTDMATGQNFVDPRLAAAGRFQPQVPTQQVPDAPMPPAASAALAPTTYGSGTYQQQVAQPDPGQDAQPPRDPRLQQGQQARILARERGAIAPGTQPQPATAPSPAPDQPPAQAAGPEFVDPRAANTNRFQAPVPPPQPEQGASLGSKIMGALGSLNPIGSAQAASSAANPAQPLTPPFHAGPPASELPPYNNAPPPPASALPPAASATPAQQAAAAGQAPAQAGPVPTSAPVAPGQQGQSVQSETPTTVVRPPLFAKPLLALEKQSPEHYKLVTQTADKYDVSPQRLAFHWYREGGLSPTAERGAAGEIGPMQIMPDTARGLDPRGTLNPARLDHALDLGASLIHQLDARYGKDTPASVMAYRAGTAQTDAVAAGKMQLTANDKAYLKAAFPGADAERITINGSGNMSPQGLLAAGNDGPQGIVNYFASHGAPGMQMTDLWRQAQGMMVAYAASHGDWNGVQHARDFVLQMSQQGAASATMSAYKALVTGDTTSAAQLLAKAHAFFPDGAMGRFGVDAQGNLWGQTMDEHDPSKALSKPFPITPTTIAPLLIATQDPNKFVQLVNEQQKANAQVRYSEAHARYMDQMPAITQEGHLIQAASREGAASTRANATVTSAAIRAGGQQAQAQATRDAHADTNLTHAFGPTSEIAQGMTPDQIGHASRLATDMQATMGPRDMPTNTAASIGKGLVEGRMQLRQMTDAHGQPAGYGVVSPQAPNDVVARMSQSAGDYHRHIAGATSMPGKGGAKPAVGAGQGSALAAVTGATGALGGASMSSALPPTRRQ